MFSILSEVKPQILAQETKKEQKEIKILVAEDNKMNQQIIKKMLSSLGFDEVKIVDNGRAAVETIMKQNYDIILMDIMVAF